MTVIENITAYMNARSQRTYTVYEASAIRSCLRIEYKLRHKRPQGLNSRSYKGQAMINKLVAKIVQERYNYNITDRDVALYKRCFMDEYHYRKDNKAS